MAKFIVVHSIKVATEFVPETFGRLTTIGPKFLLPVGNKGEHKPKQVCHCECGNTTVVCTPGLYRGTTTSCGCYAMDILESRNTTHGDNRSKEHQTWQRLKSRCHNKNLPDYRYYGGRGIRVCDRWLEPLNGYSNFLEDMGRKPSSLHTIDRIDVNGDYSPENCKWATRKEQCRNQTTNRLITAFGRTQCLADWSDEFGIHQNTIRHRLRSGWDTETALSMPVTRQRKKY
jgi:hypothetical protein